MSTSHAPGPAPSAGTDAAAVLQFWREAGPARWFGKDEAFDRQFRERFLEAHLAAARRELDGWLDDADGALALLILLDQFPRNAFRGTAHMFATDALALHLAGKAVAAGLDRAMDPALRAFCYLPWEHSEDPADQRRALELMAGLDADSLRWAQLHADIIERFGRFPHRNAVLLRESTEDEDEFLAGGGFSG